MHAQHARGAVGRSAMVGARPRKARRIELSVAVMVVPSMAVVPWRACARATVAPASPPCMMSTPAAPCTCRSMKPGRMVSVLSAPLSSRMCRMRWSKAMLPLIQPSG
jgi:hypothetical protein